MADSLRCHHCSRYLGESAIVLKFVGVVKLAEDRELVKPPRDTRKCKACGWTNIFQPLDAAAAVS